MGWLLFLFACAPEVWTRAGQVEGVDAWIALQGDGASAIAYLCGGPASLETHTRWLLGADGGASLDLARDGWSLTADLPAAGGPDGGTLTDPDGRVYAFHTEDDAALFTALESGCRDGAIVRPAAGGGAAVQGAWCDRAGAIAPVQPIGGVALEEDALTVEVDTGASRRVFTMTPMTPAALAE